jgi:hypothetical protein
LLVSIATGDHHDRADHDHHAASGDLHDDHDAADAAAVT